MAAAKKVKINGDANDLLDRIRNDDLFKCVHNTLNELLDPMLFIGRCPEQVTAFLLETIHPLLEEYKDVLNSELKSGVNV